MRKDRLKNEQINLKTICPHCNQYITSHYIDKIWYRPRSNDYCVSIKCKREICGYQVKKVFRGIKLD